MIKAPNDIYEYVKTEETRFAQPITVTDSWEWGMKEHIEEAVVYKHSQLMGDKKKGSADEKPVKNIVRPILNLQYRAEGFDVKDILLYIDDADEYYKSFLVQKYHERWAKEHGIDTLIDKSVESYVDFGGALLKKTTRGPELVPWQSIAFCDQSSFLSGPFAIKHQLSPDQLLDMAALGWGKPENGATATLEEVIALAEDYKVPDAQDGKQVKTPGKYIEAYEVHGTLPGKYLSGIPTDQSYVSQMQVICFYTTTSGDKKGITLFKGKEPKLNFKLILRDEIYGRALGFGGVEELTEAQVWTNYGEIHRKNMLDAASKTLLITEDPTLAQKHPSGLKNLDNMELIEEAPGGNTRQLDTFPRNYKLFEDAANIWQAHAQQMGAANDSILGESPNAGTPFKLQELVTQEAHGLHDYRKGKLAVFWEEVYREWILPMMIEEMNKGSEFLAELSLEELETIADQIVTNVANDFAKKKLLAGEVPTPDDLDLFKQTTRDQFMKSGSKRFLKIFKDEMAEVPTEVQINIVGKQKDLAARVDKLSNVMRFVFSTFNPQTGSFAALDDPRLLKPLNEMLEASGISPISSFRSMEAKQQSQQTIQAQQPQQAPQPQPVPSALPVNQPAQ